MYSTVFTSIRVAAFLLTSAAALPHVVEERHVRLLHGVLEVHVREDDVGRLAAQLECDAFHRVRRATLDQLAHLRGS